MNIFKVLANGHGSVNENNISAFLGYLLDPNANHALGYEFLKSFVLELEIEEKDENPFNIEAHDIQVYYEQKYNLPKTEENKSKNEIIDIVIVCSKIEVGKGSSTQMLNYLSNTKKIKKVFLIENKIKASSITKGQISRQQKAFNHELTKLDINYKIDVYSIYITPDDDKLKVEFLESNLNNSRHVFWKSQKKDNISIKQLLIDLINRDEGSLIDPLNDYTKYTTKAFIQFIDSGFKSEIEEEKEKSYDGSYTRKYIQLNTDSNIEERLSKLRFELLSFQSDLDISLPDLSKPRSPILFLVHNEIKIELHCGFEPRGRLKFLYRVHNKSEDSLKNLINLAKYLNIQLKNKTSKRMTYCGTDEMNQNIFIISDSFQIYQSLKKVIKNIDDSLLN